MAVPFLIALDSVEWGRGSGRPAGPPPELPRSAPHLFHGSAVATDLRRPAWVLRSAEEASAVGLEHMTRLDDELVRPLLQLAARIRQESQPRRKRSRRLIEMLPGVG